VIAIAPAPPANRWPVAVKASAVAGGALIDLAAVDLLMFDASLPLAARASAAAALHALAVVLIWAVPNVRTSRRRLAAAAVLAMPLAGLAVAAAAFAGGGRRKIVMRHARARRRAATSRLADARRLMDALGPYDALARGDDERRLAALRALGSRADPEAIVSLRHAAASDDPDLAWSAALALDEIAERAERRLRPLPRAKKPQRAAV